MTSFDTTLSSFNLEKKNFFFLKNAKKAQKYPEKF